MEGMRDNLMCPIHLDLLENAKTLPCQHVVCEECIALWVAKKGHLLCPTCKASHALPAGGVENLPDNFMINGLVDEFRKVSGKPGKKSKSPRKSSKDETKGEKTSKAKQRVDFKNCYIEKKSKNHEDVCGSAITLHVQLCDLGKKPVRATEADRLNAGVMTPGGKKIPAHVRKENGVFVVSFVPRMCGVHRVEAILGKQNVKGSPMIVVVRPKGHFLSGIGGLLRCPRDVVAVGHSLYVTDAKCGAYFCTDWLGRETFQVQPPKGKAVDEVSPAGICFSEEDDKVYVSDNANGCCYIYKKGASVSTFGTKGLSNPTGIAVDSNKSIYVLDRGSAEVVMFGANLSHTKNIDPYGSGKKADCRPSLTGLALNQAEDKLVIADQANCCLKVVSINGEGGTHTITTRVGPSQAHPHSVAVDKDDNIYATVQYQPSEQKGPTKGPNKPAPKPLIAGLRGEQKGCVLMFNNEGYFLGRFGDGELHNPGGICVMEEPSLTVIVVDMDGTGYGSNAAGLKIFSI